MDTHLAVLEVVEEDVEALGLDAVVLDDDARAADDLARVALAVDLAETGPGAEQLRVGDLDEVDLVLRAERLDELDVLRLRARLDEDAQVGLALVKRLGALAETTSETVVNEGVLQDLLYSGVSRQESRLAAVRCICTDLKRLLDGELPLGCLDRCLDLDGRVDLDFIRSVRHPARSIGLSTFIERLK